MPSHGAIVIAIDLSGVGNLSNLGYAMTNIAQVLNSSH